MLLIALIHWIIEMIRDRKTVPAPVSAPRRDGGHIPDHLWEKSKNWTGKYNDIW